MRRVPPLQSILKMAKTQFLMFLNAEFLVNLFFRFSGRALDYFRQHMHQLLSLVSHPRLFGADLLWYEIAGFLPLVIVLKFAL